MSISLFGKKDRVIRVAFASGDTHMDEKGANAERSRTYDYFILEEGQKAKKGDFAVVAVHGLLKIVQIKEVLRSSSKATRHAISVFSLDAWNDEMARKAKIEELQEQIFARAEEATKLKKLEELAGSDAILKGLLDELKELQK